MENLKKQLPINERYGIRGISFSDLIAIESSVERWFEHRRMESEALSFGTHVHSFISHGKLKNVPTGTVSEKKLQAEIYFGKKHFTILGTPDSYDDEIIYEYKSSNKLWNKKKSMENPQFPTYAFLIRENTGKLLKKGKLISLETKYDEESEGIALTGKIQVIDVDISVMDLLKIKVRFIKAYEKVINYMTEKSIN